MINQKLLNIQKDTEKKAILWLIASSMAALTILFLSDSYGGEGDAFTHYFISKQAWNDPVLIMDLWGRPLFTLTTMPLAQFGFKALFLYSLLLSLASAWLSYKILDKAGFPNAWMALPFVFFTPVFFRLVFHPLTETLMAFMLVLAIWLFVNQKYLLSAVVTGLMPFARLEAFVILPAFALALAVRKKYPHILMLLGGYILFGVLVLIVFGDFLWFIHKNPYSNGATALYGTGSLFHFLNHTDKLTGYPLMILSIIGVIFWAINILKMKQQWPRAACDLALWILLTGTFWLYFSAHSYSWWSGKGNSLGLLRVIGAVTPSAAMLAVVGLHHINNFLNKIKFKDKWVNLVVIVLVIWSAFVYEYPIKSGAEEKEYKKVVAWIKEHQLLERKTFYFHPLFGILTNKSAFETEKGQMVIHFAGFDKNKLAEGDILVWDAHFGPNEGQTPIETLLEDSTMKLLKIIEPEVKFKTLGNRDFAIFVLEKIKDSKYPLKFDAERNRYFILQENFEQGRRSMFASDSTDVFEGKKSMRMETNQEFYELLNTRLSLIDFPSAASTIKASVWIKPTGEESGTFVKLVIDAQSDSRRKYVAAVNPAMPLEKNKWIYLEVSAKITQARKNEPLKVYIWRLSKYPIMVDNAEIWLPAMSRP